MAAFDKHVTLCTYCVRSQLFKSRANIQPETLFSPATISENFSNILENSNSFSFHSDGVNFQEETGFLSATMSFNLSLEKRQSFVLLHNDVIYCRRTCQLLYH